MKLKILGYKLGIVTLGTVMALTTVLTNMPAIQAETVSNTSNTMGPVTGNATTSADSKDNAVKNVVDVKMLNGQLRVTFLKDNEFRLNFEKTGNEFVKNAKPQISEEYNKVFILDKYASDFTGVEPTIDESGDVITLSTKKVKLVIDKNTSLMKLLDTNGNVKWEEEQPLSISEGKTIQTLKTNEDEYFYGGGTQNGYFSHKNTKLKIEIEGGWEDGGRSNPVPFYMSTNGYAVMRHTFTKGEYDFSSTASFMHQEERFDAFYFVNDSLKEEINAFTELTGRPTFYPRWAEYLGHADCYNYNANTGERDLNNQGKKVLDMYLDEHNVPLGWMLVNDGYGCHYGKTGTVDGNVQNLKTFVDYASSRGVETGLWTQSSLRDESPKILRNIDKEVNVAGTRAIKTDVAWVGKGYDMQLNSVKTGYDGIAQSGERPFIFSLNGWAGSQRYAGMWTGDQTGGRWEYIRFMIPSYIGSGLSGQPNVGSDIDSIYKGSKTIATRDMQWKTFTPLLYNMGGWDGSSADQLDGKTPWEFGPDSEAIQQFYLKTRAEMTPYNYTNSHTASVNGTPMLRAMVLEYPNEPYTYGKETQYQYMWGENLLVAPVYEGTGKDTDIGLRNNIYLPDENQTWIDYFTGTQYQGGKVINNFDAPIWKLPLFVKSGAIIPLTEENNASAEITDDKDRIFNIYPDGKTSFDLYEDDGHSIKTGTATTHITSDAPEIDKDGKASDGTASITIEKRVESGYDAKDKATELFINTHKKPTSVTLKFNGNVQTLKEVTKEAYQKAVKDGDDSKNIYYYDEDFNLAKYDGSQYINDGNAVNPGPRLVVRTVKADVSETEMSLEVEGFNNSAYAQPGEGSAPATAPIFNTADEEKITPTSITLTWNEVADATSYDMRINGTLFTNVSKPNETSFLHKDLLNKTKYSYEVRAVNKYGASTWSAPYDITTKEDPFKFSPENISISWDGPDKLSGVLGDVVDKNLGTQFHSAVGATNAKITLDMNYAYPINQFVYVPRQDYGGTGGNGLVQKMNLEVSLDGKTWKKVKTDYTVNSGVVQPMFNNVFADVITFDATYARYVRMTVLSSVGTFFSAQELIPCFAEGGKPRTAGTPLEHTNALSDTDLIPMKMYSGSIPGDTTWNQVEAADANYNKISDAYDLVNITSKLDGGVIASKDDSIDGVMNIALNKTGALNTNDVVRVDVVGNSFKDINALSLELGFNSDAFEVVNKDTNFFNPAVNTLGMMNYSRYNPHGSTSIEPSVYIDMANRGEKQRLNGDIVIGSFTLKATKDNVKPLITMKNALIVNSNMVQKDAKVDSITPEEPTVVENKVARKDITLTFTTPGISNDDGSNLIQYGKSGVESLLDGNLNSNMEFLWSRPADEKVVILPCTMNFVFNNTKNITGLKVYNRISGNGHILEMQAIGYLGETAYDLGTYDTNSANYDKATGIYSFSTPNGSSMFDRVEIIAKKADNMTMMTLREVEIMESNDVATTSVTLSTDEDLNMNVGKTKTVGVQVGPANALNKNVEVEVDDNDVVSANLVKDGEGNVMVMVQSLKEGNAKVTVKSSSNPDVKAVLNVNVVAGLDQGDYTKFMTIASEKLAKGDLYQKAGRDELQVAYDTAAEANLDTITQEDLDALVLTLVKAVNSLVERVTDTSELIPGSALSAEALYSESNLASRVLDDNLNTFWESPYGGSNVGLPKTITITLPTESTIRQLDYVPAQARNGLVTEYAVHTSVDGINYETVAQGVFNRSSETDYSTQAIKFKSTQAKYVQFEVKKALGRESIEDNKYARVAELRLYGVADATSITVNPTEVELKINETKAVGVTLEPVYSSKDLEWTSANESIATVDSNGVITAVASGTVEISVAGSKASATVNVTVNPLRDLTKLIDDMDVFVEGIEKPLNVYTKTTWEAFSTALKEAKAMKATDTQAAIDSKATELQNAFDDLLELTSLERLNAAIKDAEGITNTDGNYTEGSFKALQDALSSSKTTAGNSAATEEELATANKNLLAAMKNLVSIKELKEAISKVEMPTGTYSTASIAAFDKVVADANALVADKDATNEACKKSVEALTNVHTLLVDVASLNTSIKAAEEALQKGENAFIPSYRKTLYDLIVQAKAKVEDALTGTEVAEIETKLNVCVSSPLYKGDKSALQTALTNAAGIIANKDQYTIVSYNVFESAYKAAEALNIDGNAVQSEIDKALSSLNEAIKALVNKSEDNGSTGDTEIKNPTGDISVSGKLPPKTEVKTRYLSEAEISLILNAVKDKEILRMYNFEKMFDIYLMNNGISYSPNGTVTVKIKLDQSMLQKELAVLYMHNDGNVTELKSYVKDGYIYFETDHFSTYAIVSKNKDYKPSNTGDTTNLGAWLLLGLCGGGFVIYSYKKRKRA